MSTIDWNAIGQALAAADRDEVTPDVDPELRSWTKVRRFNPASRETVMRSVRRGAKRSAESKKRDVALKKAGIT